MGNATLVTTKKYSKVGFCTDVVVFAWKTIIMQKANASILRNALKLHIWRVYHDLLVLLSRTFFYFDCAISIFIQKGKSPQKYKLKGISMDKT
jgi:hypothetical protein